VLILLPASERKTLVEVGEPLDPDALSFPPLAPTRAAVMGALMEVSAAPDATKELGVPPGLTDVVRANVWLDDTPSAPAESVYAGVLFDALALDDLDAASRRRARGWIVIVSALWGAVRLDDHIPPYRLNMCGRLPGLDHLPQVWQQPLGEVLPAAAGRGLVVDCRRAEYATAWRPAGALAERTVSLKIVRDLDGGRGAGAHNAKRTQGLVVRRIVLDALDRRRPEELADRLSHHFAVDLRRAARGAGWELRVVEQPA
jgi:cytoplasmic iron level regulating protein YaaA (DUF328/UPF0246 family)